MPAPTRTKPLTMEQRINQMVARHQFWFDPIDSPEQYLHCSWCEEKVHIDYFMFGYREMTKMLTDFIKQHEKCEPALKSKTKAMMLTPKEQVG